MTLVPSFTFSGGALDPGLWGRVDLNKYQTGVKIAKNFVVAVEGGMNKRWGQYFIGKPKAQTGGVKLVPWKIADDDSYVLEFGQEYIRLIRFGGYVLYPEDHVPDPDSDAVDVDGFLEIPTPYDADHVRELKFTFANDIMYIFHENYQPREIRRLGLYDWQSIATNFDPHVGAPTGLAAVGQRISGATWVDDPPPQEDFDDYEPAPKEHKYKVAAIMDNELQTKVSPAVAIDYDLGNHRFRVKLTWNAVTDAERYLIYKGNTGIFGYIGEVPAGEPRIFYDTNYAPSFDQVPIARLGGFGEDQWPRVGEFYKQRMLYAATKKKPQDLWGSRPLFFDSLSSSIPLQDDDAFHVPLVGKNRHTINHMLELDKFILFTDSAEWVLETTGGDALSASTIDPKPKTYYGSDPYLTPIPIGDRILFVENITGIIRDLGYEFVQDTYSADDLSRLARHLFVNKDIRAWDYTAHPQSLVHAVLTGGFCPTMTYIREHEIWGWTEFQTQGDYIDVATVSEINQDATYFIVRRKIGDEWIRFTERVEVNYSGRIEEMFYVDCGLSFSRPREFTELTLDLTPGFQSLTITAPGVKNKEEIQIEAGDFILRCVVTGKVGDVVTSNQLLYGQDWPEEGFVPPQRTGIAYVATDTISGFEHLAGMTIIGLGDGAVIEDLVVDENGEFELPFPVVRFHGGLPYEAELVTLDLDDERAAGRYIERTVDLITLRLSNSRGVFVGPSNLPEAIQQIESREGEDYHEVNIPLNGAYELPVEPAWGKTCGVVVKAPWPLPCNVLNIIPELVYGN